MPKKKSAKKGRGPSMPKKKSAKKGRGRTAAPAPRPPRAPKASPTPGPAAVLYERRPNER